MVDTFILSQLDGERRASEHEIRLELGIATDLPIRCDSDTLGPTSIRFRYFRYDLILIL